MVLKVDERLREVNVLTDRVRRRKQEYRDAKIYVSAHRSRLATESWKESEGQPLVVRRAKLFKSIMEGIPIAIREGELIVGSQTEYIRGVNPDIDVEEAGHVRGRIVGEKVTVTSPRIQAAVPEEAKESILRDLDYWQGKTACSLVEETWRALWGDRWALFQEVRIARDPHGVPAARTGDWGKVLNKGLKAIIAEAEEGIRNLKVFDEDETRRLYFFQAVILACRGVISYAARAANVARQMASAEKDPARREELERVAAICEWVPANPARSFHEALQSFFTCFLALHLEIAGIAETPGRFDQYMYPFYRKDVDEGRITRQQAAELLGLLVVKLMEFDDWGSRLRRERVMGSHNINLTLGGVSSDGGDAGNELSILFLEVIRQLKPHQPHVSLRYHDRMSEELLVKAVETNRDHGGGMPAFFNDKVSVLALVEKGIPLSEARDWIPQGCVERCVPTAGLYKGGPFFSLPKILEITLNNGVDPRTGKRVGLVTGDPREFGSFDEFYQAFKKQTGFFIDALIDITNIWFVVRGDNLALPFNSALMTGCMEAGKDTLSAGARWNKKFLASLRPFGHQNTVNSLANIRKLVFEDKKVSVGELIEGLAADFAGKEKLHAVLLAGPKWGNDDDYVDLMMKELFDWTRYMVVRRKNPWGEPWSISRQGLTYHFFLGQVVGALPDGRKAWEPLADGSVSAMRGTDRKGPTAVLNSAAKVDHLGCDSTLLNLKFHPGPLQSREGINKFIALIKTYFDNYGHHVQFNMISRETLLNAKAHPEEYRDLVVRVAGFSAFFVDLAPEVQEEIIARTEHRI